MNSQSLTIITVICLAFMAAIPALVPGGEVEEKAPAFSDCPVESRTAIPVTATYSFTYCQADSTVWMNKQWSDPTPFELRWINTELKGREN